MESVERWWTQKYSLPSNHSLFLDSTQFELLTEFWEDYYIQHPLDAHRNPDGTIQFKDTGDALIDKWEEQIAAGETPDFLEDFTPEQREKLEKLRTQGSTPRLQRSMKDVVESIDEEARKQGLGLPQRSGWVSKEVTKFPSPFKTG